MSPLPDYPNRGPGPDGAHHTLRLRLGDQAAADGGGPEEHEEQRHHGGHGGGDRCSIVIVETWHGLNKSNHFSWNYSI